MCIRDRHTAIWDSIGLLNDIEFTVLIPSMMDIHIITAQRHCICRDEPGIDVRMKQSPAPKKVAAFPDSQGGSEDVYKRQVLG